MSGEKRGNKSSYYHSEKIDIDGVGKKGTFIERGVQSAVLDDLGGHLWHQIGRNSEGKFFLQRKAGYLFARILAMMPCGKASFIRLSK